MPDETKSLADGAIKAWWARHPKVKQIFNQGIEALATTRVVIRPAGKMSGEGYVTSTQGGLTQRSFSGSGADEDIVVSSARAYVR